MLIQTMALTIHQPPPLAGHHLTLSNTGQTNLRGTTRYSEHCHINPSHHSYYHNANNKELTCFQDVVIFEVSEVRCVAASCLYSPSQCWTTCRYWQIPRLWILHPQKKSIDTRFIYGSSKEMMLESFIFPCDNHLIFCFHTLHCIAAHKS